MEIADVLTSDSLEKLLLHLDEDRERAGEKYQTLRRGLIRFFEWRGCRFAEDHADETMDRVARKIAQGEDILNVHAYMARVARFVFLEFLRDKEKQQAALRQQPFQPISEAPEADEARTECLRRCLQGLPPESSQLMMLYYQHDGKDKIEMRKKLAQQLGISPQTLRMRMQRLRARLEECIVDCVKHGLPGID